jgi:hypothetical protein
MVLLEKYKKLFGELLSDPYHASGLHYKELEIMACLVNVILSRPHSVRNPQSRRVPSYIDSEKQIFERAVD